MEPRVTGRFYFKQTSNGNLIGEFSNYQNNGIFTESCDLRSSDSGENINGDYFGNYHSTWQENGKSVFAQLTISPATRNQRLFDLEWRDNGGNLIFRGEGMLCDNILIGDYHRVSE